MSPGTPFSPASPVPQGVLSLHADDIRQILTSVLQEDMTSQARVGLERILGWATASTEVVTSTEGQVGQQHLEDEPAACTLDDVRRSFMKMAPEAFEYCEIDDPDAFWVNYKFSESYLVDFWGKVWDSFDLNDLNQSQYIDVELPWSEQPRDIQIFLAALGAFPREGGEDRYIDVLVPAALALETDHPGVSGAVIDAGAALLNGMIKYNHGLQPSAPALKPSPSSTVPFPWLDVRLSHFQHLGWRLLNKPDIADQVIDYNDSYDPEDPYGRIYRLPCDHFSRWKYGGLLMVSNDLGGCVLALITKTCVRVPLPRPLYSSNMLLAQAVREFYSLEHPLCMVDRAWRFALEICDSRPTDADLRAAMVYQVAFTLNRCGILSSPWAHLSKDWSLTWPYKNLEHLPRRGRRDVRLDLQCKVQSN